MPKCSVCGNALITEMQSLQAQLAALQAVAKAAERYEAARSKYLLGEGFHNADAEDRALQDVLNAVRAARAAGAME